MAERFWLWPVLRCLLAKGRLQSETPLGTTDKEFNFCLLSSSHGPSTAAHEAGDYLFAKIQDGMWHNLGHPWSIRDPDKTPLMRDGGAGFKIQFDLALQSRISSVCFTALEQLRRSILNSESLSEVNACARGGFLVTPSNVLSKAS
jgi:hypothetical protein